MMIQHPSISIGDTIGTQAGNIYTYMQGRIMTFCCPLANEIMGPLRRFILS